MFRRIEHSLYKEEDTAQTKSDYPRDEFDAFSAVAGGAHRGEETILARVMPFIIAMIVAALCALAFFNMDE